MLNFIRLPLSPSRPSPCPFSPMYLTSISDLTLHNIIMIFLSLQKSLVIRRGPIFITKNPCVHPGDLQKFTAKNVPALHHMIDVVVFPAKGKRPHPNELSGLSILVL